MSTYADLSIYEYSDSDAPMVNIGWLGTGADFEHGEVDDAIIEKLIWLADDPLNRMRGWHDCELCTEESPIEIHREGARGGAILLGNGEIHVAGERGFVYVAPTLVIHYVLKHRYLPPSEFLEAVRSLI